MTKQKSESFYKRAVLINSTKDCKKLLARLIWLRQKDLIADEKAKTISSLIGRYAEITRVEKLDEIEARLETLETKAGGLDGNN